MKIKKLTIAWGMLLALLLLLIPTMAFASTGSVQGSNGWLAVMALGTVAAGAAAARAEKDDDKDARLEDEPDKEPTEDAAEGSEPTGECSACGSANEENAKFCDQCGASMAARAEGEDGPPSSKPMGAKAPAVKRMNAEASVAGILGASSDSIPAIKSAAIEKRYVFDTAAAVFGSADPGEIVGQMLTVNERLAAGAKASAEMAKTKITSEKSERWQLAKRLNALNVEGRPRSSIFKDKVNEATGERTAIGLREEYATMDLAVMRGVVTGLERGRAKAKVRNPFQPDEKAAEAHARAKDPRLPPSADAPAADVVTWAKAQPAFVSMRKQMPVTITDEAIGRELAKTMRGGVK